MHIPRVTDEQFDKVVEAAKSPIFVLVTVADDAESDAARYVCRQAADEYDDRVIFFETLVDEEPGRALMLGVTRVPCILVKRYSDTVWRQTNPVTPTTVSSVLAEVCAK